MTWVKPSAVWMAYRCGFGYMKNDKNQERVLALDVDRERFVADVLGRAVLSTHGSGSGSCGAVGSRVVEKDASPVVVQWDPERVLVA